MSVIPWLLLGLQIAIVLGSLTGYGLFTARPDLLLKLGPDAIAFYAWAFHGFAILNIAIGGFAVAAEAFLRNRFRVFALAAAAVYFLSLSSELMGTTYGIPFGAYSYTALLGPKWFDKVPLLIPWSWLTMAWPAWVVARQWTKGWNAVWVGSALLVAWDLALDPAMSSITQYWIWADKGDYYYGMPLNNVLGWSVTGLVLLTVLMRLAPEPRGGVGFALAVYSVNLALPLGFCILKGYWLAVSAGCASLLAALALAVTGLDRRMSGDRSYLKNRIA